MPVRFKNNTVISIIMYSEENAVKKYDMALSVSHVVFTLYQYHPLS
jgi:hypothetical protein